MPDALINDYMFWQEGESLLMGHLKREIDARVMTKTRLRVEVVKVSCLLRMPNQSHGAG
jgi:hypothetical protein